MLEIGEKDWNVSSVIIFYNFFTSNMLKTILEQNHVTEKAKHFEWYGQQLIIFSNAAFERQVLSLNFRMPAAFLEDLSIVICKESTHFTRLSMSDVFFSTKKCWKIVTIKVRIINIICQFLSNLNTYALTLNHYWTFSFCMRVFYSHACQSSHF